METADGEFPANTQTHGRLPFFFLSPPAVCPSVLSLVSLPVSLAQAAEWPSCVGLCNTATVQPPPQKTWTFWPFVLKLTLIKAQNGQRWLFLSCEKHKIMLQVYFHRCQMVIWWSSLSEQYQCVLLTVPSLFIIHSTSNVTLKCCPMHKKPCSQKTGTQLQQFPSVLFHQECVHYLSFHCQYLLIHPSGVKWISEDEAVPLLSISVWFSGCF